MATFKNKKHKPTKFQSKWGYLVQDLAEKEGVTCDALHMRVRNYGTPFQRAAKPDRYERRYGKTQMEIAIERGLSYNTIMFYEDHYGGAYHAEDNPNLLNRTRNLPEPVNGSRRRDNFWLHPEHPRYQDARDCKWFGDDDA